MTDTKNLTDLSIILEKDSIELKGIRRPPVTEQASWIRLSSEASNVNWLLPSKPMVDPQRAASLQSGQTAPISTSDCHSCQ